MYEHAFGASDKPLETVPIGHTVELRAAHFGAWCVAELGNGALQDAVLESARYGVLGFSMRATDTDPHIDDDAAGELPRVTRRTLRLREVSVTAEPAWAPESMITFVGGQPVERQTTALPAANFFELCDQLAAIRGENNHERVNAILTRNAAQRERGKQRWLTEIDDARKQMALASTWRQRSAQIQQDARSQGRPLSKADMAWQLTLCSQAAGVEAEAKPILDSFGLLDETDTSPPAQPSRQW